MPRLLNSSNTIEKFIDGESRLPKLEELMKRINLEYIIWSKKKTKEEEKNMNKLHQDQHCSKEGKNETFKL